MTQSLCLVVWLSELLPVSLLHRFLMFPVKILSQEFPLIELYLPSQLGKKKINHFVLQNNAQAKLDVLHTNSCQVRA